MSLEGIVPPQPVIIFPGGRGLRPDTKQSRESTASTERGPSGAAYDRQEGKEKGGAVKKTAQEPSLLRVSVLHVECAVMSHMSPFLVDLDGEAEIILIK
jgi:hypothetical protein